MDGQTYFAKPDRSSPEDVKSDYDFLESEKMFLDVFGSLSGIAAILDNNRQIVYGNSELLNLLGIKSIEDILGKRPGEAVSCIHADENSNGCGTSEACSVCGAVNAIIISQQTGQKTVRESRITSEKEGKKVNWDLRIVSSPLKIKGMQYYVFNIQDISVEKRKDHLERIFFHDLLNSAGSLNGLLTILKNGTDPKEEREIIEMSEEVSRDMIEEILIHRQLQQAENGDLVVDIQMHNSFDLLKSVVSRIERHPSARDKRIIILDTSCGEEIKTDRILVHRVLLNLLKNALEATKDGGIVYAKVLNFPDKIRFEIKNDAVIPKEVQLQVFQRSFSTRGQGRGLGTYSIKLISENYLNGKVSFTSSEPAGTVFTVDLFKAK
jgi:K+-sensing histidine kinase KdpD